MSIGDGGHKGHGGHGGALARVRVTVDCVLAGHPIKIMPAYTVSARLPYKVFKPGRLNV